MELVSLALAWLYLPGATDRPPAARHRWPQVAATLRTCPDHPAWLNALRRDGFWEEALLLEGFKPDWPRPMAITAVDPNFPAVWIDHLGYRCPPALWCDRPLGDRPAGPESVVTVVGSRDIGPMDTALAHSVGLALAGSGYLVASGGAPGCDHHAVRGALASRSRRPVPTVGSSVIAAPRTSGCVSPDIMAWEILPHGLGLTRAQTSWSHSEGQPGLGRLSATFAQGRFNMPQAIERNTLLYSLGLATVVVRVQAGTGGTWRAATDALRRRLGPVVVFCDDANFGRCAAPLRAGAQGLVARGAHAVQNIEQLMTVLAQFAAARRPVSRTHQTSLFA